MDSHADLERVTAILSTYLHALSLIIDQHIQIPKFIPLRCVGAPHSRGGCPSGAHQRAGIAANVSVSIQALLAHRGQAGPAEVMEFYGTVQVQAIGRQIKDFGDLQFVSPVTLLSWPDHL